MYIVHNGELRMTSEKENAVLELCPPAYWENGEKRELVHQADGSFSNEHYAVTLTIEQRTPSIFHIRRNWKNISGQSRQLQTIFRAKACFDVKQYLIPCVSVNGNDFGKGFEPKGLTRDGENWIFAYDRTSIPACSVLENSDYATALFASPEDVDSLQASCSVGKEGNVFYQEIIHPVKETPVTYSSRDKYDAPYNTYLTLAPGESFDCGIYIYVTKPRWENFGIAGLLDEALSIFGTKQNISVNEEQLWHDSITFAKSLISDYHGKKGFIIGFFPSAEGFRYREDQCFELAWCGQNILFCRMLIEDYRRYGNRENLELALEILDTRIHCCTAESGLMAGQLRDSENLNSARVDTCNEGYGAYELLRVYQLLQSMGIEKPEYLATAKGVCDFFRDHYSMEYGFGKQWTLTGECTGTNGTIGAFLILPMCKLYELTGEIKYLETAEEAMKFYVNRDLNRFCCTAGALDTDCVDKETSAPLIFGGVLLYKLTRDPVYLEYAQKAAYYFVSWMYHYDPVYGPETEFAQYGVTVKGMTSVSAQHHHLDCYGSLIVPYLRKLAEYTGDETWNVRADLLWKATLQYIGDGKLTHRGLVREPGSQNEAIFHCRWGFGQGHFQRGDLNDWLVAWPCAYRLSVMAQQDF